MNTPNPTTTTAPRQLTTAHEWSAKAQRIAAFAEDTRATDPELAAWYDAQALVFLSEADRARREEAEAAR